MINVIIFSQDGAAQLHSLLESIEKRSGNIFQINVLYDASNEEFEKSYLRLAEKIADKNKISIFWVKKQEYKKQVLEMLNTDLKYTCFFSDFDFLHGNIDNKIIDSFNEEDFFCFSLRLGKNIKKCNVIEADNVFIPQYEKNEFVFWNWKNHYTDFGFPFSTSGHMFRTKEIKKMIKAIRFDNQMELEEGLFMFDDFPKEIMGAYKKSKITSFPYLNKKELNQKYLNGEILALETETLSNTESISPALTELKFKKHE